MYKLFNLESIETKNKPGCLVNIKINDICKKEQIEFTQTGMFYLNNLNSNESRGLHSNGSVSEILICLSGSFTIKLNNRKKEEIIEIKENNGIFIDKDIWIEFYQFNNCVILVLLNNNHPYSENYYIFDEYMKINSIL
jgi:mannose-6-phosphate isomerase-like protein (cupin superfamily)